MNHLIVGRATGYRMTLAACEGVPRFWCSGVSLSLKDAIDMRAWLTGFIEANTIGHHGPSAHVEEEV